MLQFHDLSTRSFLRCALALFLPLALVMLAPAQGNAKGRQKSTRIFILEEVKEKKPLPKQSNKEQSQLESLLRSAFKEAIDSETSVGDALPSDAPPLNTDQKGLAGNTELRKFLKQRKIQPYRVWLEVLSEELIIKVNPKKPGKLVTVSLSLRMFGETLPERVMAFTGEGSATIAIEVGKKVSPRDLAYAKEEAAKLATSEALAMSLKKLSAPASTTKKRRKRH